MSSPFDAFRPEAWMQDALCAQVDPELWHPEKGGHNGAEAIKICKRCSLQQECLEYALRMEVGVTGRYGIYGATTPMQRRRIAQQRKKAAS